MTSYFFWLCYYSTIWYVTVVTEHIKAAFEVHIHIAEKKRFHHYICVLRQRCTTNGPKKRGYRQKPSLPVDGVS